MKELLVSCGGRDSLEELCDAPFRPKRLRFARFAGRPRGKRRAWYQCFMCHFDGDVKDLLSKRSEWTGLTHDTDYRFCNGLGREARREKLHGLVAPSVRRIEGANLPLFER